MDTHDDWFDDYIIMEMMEGEDDCRESGSPSYSGSGCGCFPVALGLLAILWLFSMVIG